MTRVNITVPDDTLNRARAAGLNVSRVASSALAHELDRLAKVAELDRYLDDLGAELGPVGAAEQAEAVEWVEQIAAGTGRESHRRTRATGPRGRAASA